MPEAEGTAAINDAGASERDGPTRAAALIDERVEEEHDAERLVGALGASFEGQTCVEHIAWVDEEL